MTDDNKNDTPQNDPNTGSDTAPPRPSIERDPTGDFYSDGSGVLPNNAYETRGSEGDGQEE